MGRAAEETDTAMRRRAFLRLPLLAAVAGASVRTTTLRAQEPSPPLGPDVPMVGVNPARTGEQPGPNPTGELTVAWTFATEGEVRSSPAVAGELVYVATADGRLHAVRRRGPVEEVWRAEGTWVATSPAVVGDTVYLGGIPALRAFDAATGDERWAFDVGQGTGTGDPAVVDGVAYVADRQGTLVALDAAEGAERWRFAFESTFEPAPAVADGVVYLNGFPHLVALDAATGAERGRFDAGPSYLNPPAVAGGTVYVVRGPGEDGTPSVLLALDAPSGAERWRFGGPENRAAATPAIAAGAVYASDGQAVHALDPATGAIRWSFATGGTVWAPPAYADGAVYVASAQYFAARSEVGFLHQLDAATGAERWRFAADAEVLAAPAVTGGLVYLTTRAGALIVLAGE